jgi:hypothetical protein
MVSVATWNGPVRVGSSVMAGLMKQDMSLKEQEEAIAGGLWRNP